MPQIKIGRFLLQYNNGEIEEEGILKLFSFKRKIRRMEKELEYCYKKYADLNRSIANEWLALDFEGLVKYENVIYDDIYKFEEGRVAESGEGVRTKSKPDY